MESLKVTLLFCSLFLCLSSITFAVKQPYVVYLGGHSHGPYVSSVVYEQVADSHSTLLSSYVGSTRMSMCTIMGLSDFDLTMQNNATGLASSNHPLLHVFGAQCKEKAKDAIFYYYTKHINGFAANLEKDEAMELAKRPDVLSVFPSRKKQTHTTHSWQFLGLENGDTGVSQNSLWSRARFGEDTIIANIDTGVWPESPSFNDEGMGPIPSRWKGICQNKTEVSCNRKLIGLRYYTKGIEAAGAVLNSTQLSPRDYEGHGSHTLSTAGGSFAPNASIFGYANGTAKGGSPNARVAAYKVCWPNYGCSDADILAAFDQAIEDGVDVLSVSVGGKVYDYFEDPLAIGAFHAVRNGVAVICSAGNEGPAAASATNVAPWMLTVGASTLDRDFPAAVKLGNNEQYNGQSLAPSMPQKFYPLINAADAVAPNATVKYAQVCLEGALDPKKVKDKVVVCLRGENARLEKGIAVRKAGGVAMILANDEASGNVIISDAHFLPATHITYTDGLALYKYLNSTKSPTAYITPPSTEFGLKPAPSMAPFSSRGPNILNPEILKPDIIAPGVGVLAAFTLEQSPTEAEYDPRRIPYTLMSGTSMSCPHISGIVGLLRTLHRDWSPAAIRSAIMTSARVRDNRMKTITNSSSDKATPFDFGAGHVRPNKAMDPGLVYELAVDDYMNFLCDSGYNSTLVTAVYGRSYTCPTKNSSLLDFNYPSITIPSLDKATTISRRVKNVGTPGTYTVRVHPPAGVSIVVQPSELTFSKNGEEKTYTMTVAPTAAHQRKGYAFGRLIWSDGVHFVRSPIVVKHKKA